MLLRIISVSCTSSNYKILTFLKMVSLNLTNKINNNWQLICNSNAAGRGLMDNYCPRAPTPSLKRYLRDLSSIANPFQLKIVYNLTFRKF